MYAVSEHYYSLLMIIMQPSLYMAALVSAPYL